MATIEPTPRACAPTDCPPVETMHLEVDPNPPKPGEFAAYVREHYAGTEFEGTFTPADEPCVDCEIIETLAQGLVDLYEYDTADPACDCGEGETHDALRAACIAELKTTSGKTVAMIARELFLSDKQLARGYGLNDVLDFLEWLADRMDYRP